MRLISFRRFKESCICACKYDSKCCHHGDADFGVPNKDCTEKKCPVMQKCKKIRERPFSSYNNYTDEA